MIPSRSGSREKLSMMSTTPSLGRPSGAKGEETRQRIMTATMQCVADVGYARATIREIARVAQMTSGSLYHYFPNKSELVKATFDEIAGLAMPRLALAAERAEGTLEKLMAVFDESERLMREYPLAVAFDRAIRVESPTSLHLVESSDTVFASLRKLIVDILEQGAREDVLGPEVRVDGAANAIYALMIGLNDLAATAQVDEYHDTVVAVGQLIRGTLFDHRKST